MIYGDPFKFSLQFEVVDCWNVQGSKWSNGIFALYIDGARIFSSVDAVELHTTFCFFRKIPFIEVDFGDASVAAVNVFESAYNYFWGDGDRLMQGVLSLTCSAMSDANVHAYLMKSHSGDRVIWSLDCGVSVSECVLDIGEVANVVRSMPHIIGSESE